MSELVYDIEAHVPAGTTGDYADASREVFCIVTQDLETQEVMRYDDAGYGDGTIEEGLGALSCASRLFGHNICRYDEPVLARLHGFEFDGDIYDTLVASQLMWPGPKWMRLADTRFVRKNPGFPRKLMGRHSLESWGHRLGEHKQEGYEGGFEVYTREMLDYCAQDVMVNTVLARYLMNRGMPDSVVHMESQVTRILRRQQAHGVYFNEKYAVELMLTLSEERDTLLETLQSTYPPQWKAHGEVVTPKVKNGPRGVAVGAQYQKIKLIEFNPGSGDQVAERLMAQGWKPSPTEYTPGGKPQVTEKILEDLTYPGIDDLIKYERCTKILGFISEGKNAWLKLVDSGGRLHGQVTATGAVTHRMSHKHPNTGQVPKVGSYLGAECRGMFCAPAGRVLVGCDAAGLQLRALAHYLARYDGGAFAKAVTEGDPHTYMMAGTGIIVRDDQKTFTYAMLFMAWFKKLGMIKINSFRRARERGEWSGTIPPNSAAIEVGRAAHEGLSELLKMGDLDGALDTAWERRHVVGLDGRIIPLISRRQVLNTLLMSFEATVMKHALLICQWLLDYAGYSDWEFVLNVHDEWQIECNPKDSVGIGWAMAESIRLVGEKFDLRCRLDGTFKIGKTWAETH